LYFDIDLSYNNAEINMTLMRTGSVSSLLIVVLNFTWYVVALALAGMTCIVLITPWVDVQSASSKIDIPVSFDLDGHTLQVNAPDVGVQDARIEHARASMSFRPPSKAAVVMLLTFVATMLGLLLWVIGQLRAVLRTLRDRRPFAPENASRIRGVGYAIIVLEFARTALVFGTNSYAMAHFSANGIRFDARPDFNLFALIHGLIILAIAEVFRAGTRLDEDQSLTI
jgi:hypothetical protein